MTTVPAPVAPFVGPDATGHFGPYGGRFVPEALVAALDELTAAHAAARTDPVFLAELDRRLLNDDATERAETVDNLRQIALLRLEAALR